MRLSANTAERAALVIASGVALALAFPKFDVAVLAWVAFIPLLYALEGETMGQIFGWAWLWGLASYTAQLYWITITLHDFADVNWVLSTLPMFALAAVVALYSAVAIWAGEFVARRLRLPLVLTLPLAWAALEFVRTYFPIGFPWNLLGESQVQNLALIQFAEFTGSYGVSALIVFFNVAIYIVLLHRGTRRLQITSLSILTALMIGAVLFGNWRIGDINAMKPQGKFRVAMVQGNIAQSIKWDPKVLAETMQVYSAQSVEAAKHGVDLIVWPEAAMPFLIQPDGLYPAGDTEDPAYRAQVLALARTIHVPLLFGAPALDVENRRITGFGNRAYLVSADGNIVAWYDKMQLVPFGEYVPLRAVFGSLVNRIVHGFGDMVPGTHQTIFEVGGAKLGVLICYESIFPRLATSAAANGADVLINITNDAWYGTSSAPYQLLAMSAMRSVETKTPMVRAANTGISAVIRPTGEIVAPTPLETRGTELEDVTWHPVVTLYTVIGDVFAEICLALTLAGVLVAWWRPKKLNPLDAHVEEILSRNGKRVAIN